MAESVYVSRSKGAKKAWDTRRSARYRANKSERASKTALAAWCRANGWKVLFFEGETGALRTGIVDTIVARIRSNDADAVDIKLVQLKAGAGGLTATEISRLKHATDALTTDWLLAAFDGETLHLVPDIPKRGRRRA